MRLLGVVYENALIIALKQKDLSLDSNNFSKFFFTGKKQAFMLPLVVEEPLSSNSFGIHHPFLHPAAEGDPAREADPVIFRL